jgi:dCTP deaminase
VQNTVIEPGWSGWLTLEIANHGREAITLTRGVGIAQILFHPLDKPTALKYTGKYQNQERGPVSAKDS